MNKTKEDSNSKQEELLEKKNQILKKGRQFRYPLQHSQKTILKISAIVASIVFITFVLTISIMVYGYRSRSDLVYNVSKILPVPMGSVDGKIFYYKDYLVLVKSSEHFIDQQLVYKKGSLAHQNKLKIIEEESLNRVVENTIAQDIAKNNNVVVTEKDIDRELLTLVAQTNLNKDQDKLKEVLSDWYGWTEEDLRSEIKIQILKQKITPFLDTKAKTTANTVYDQIKSGAEFDGLAKKYSDDASSADKGGDIGVVEKNSSILPVSLIDALYELPVGGVSKPIATPDGFYIIKCSSETNGARSAKYIFIAFQKSSDMLVEKRKSADINLYVPKS